MLLRASGEQSGEDYVLNAVTDDTTNSGVPYAQLLRGGVQGKPEIRHMRLSPFVQ